MCSYVEDYFVTSNDYKKKCHKIIDLFFILEISFIRMSIADWYFCKNYI